MEIVCKDFKIFNPLNDKLISDSTFPKLQTFKVGLLDDEKFPKFISPNSVLYAPTLT